MRMIVPPVLRRREMDRLFVEFFREHRSVSFRRAVSGFCRFYGVRSPRIEWYEYIDWGKTAGKTFEDGRIHLVHPENWKRGRIYKSERMWVQTVYHELAHYLFWTDAERKADAFTQRMVRGLRRVSSAGASVTVVRRPKTARRRLARPVFNEANRLRARRARGQRRRPATGQTRRPVRAKARRALRA